MRPKIAIGRGQQTAHICVLLVLLLFWHAPLGVRSAIRRHQPAQRTVLGQVDCFVQCEVVGFQIALDGVQPRDMRTPWWSLPVIGRGAGRIISASASSPILSYPPHLIIANKLLPFDSKHRSQAFVFARRKN